MDIIDFYNEAKRYKAAIDANYEVFGDKDVYRTLSEALDMAIKAMSKKYYVARRLTGLRLTATERKVAMALFEGYTTSEIQIDLQLAGIQQVYNYRTAIIRKLGITNTEQLIPYIQTIENEYPRWWAKETGIRIENTPLTISESHATMDAHPAADEATEA